MTSTVIDPVTANAARVFLEYTAQRSPVDHAVRYGSRAWQPDSDADLAIIMREQAGDRSATAVTLAGIAFDVLLDTGILVSAISLWRDGLAHPEQFSNPALIDNIRREGVRFPAPPNDFRNTVRFQDVPQRANYGNCQAIQQGANCHPQKYSG